MIIALYTFSFLDTALYGRVFDSVRAGAALLLDNNASKSLVMALVAVALTGTF